MGTASATSTALEALHAKLDEHAAETYWAALSRFLRFELEKPEFDRLALEAVGPHVSLHNAVIFALLKDAQCGRDDAPAPMDVDAAHPFVAYHVFPPKANAADAAATHGHSSGASGAGEGGLAAGAQPSAPKLMLKISRDGSATAQRTDLIVDAQEEAQVRELYSLSPRNPCVVAHPAGKSLIGTFLLVLIALRLAFPLASQLNALHDRLIELAKQHGLQGVQPEAVSFMQRAVRVVSHRLLAAAALGGSAGAPPTEETEESRPITTGNIYDAIRLPAPAPWMAPPCQRAGSTLGAYSKFVS